MAGRGGRTAASVTRKVWTRESPMWTKVIFGLVGIALLTTFVSPIVIKLKDPALIVVVLVGLAMMIYDFIEFLREKD
jgi:hypothetical protein